ncbi:MAG TPA: VTT domain-containing protein [Methylomirabilota bacterium]|nr:VTT domain-containing protein [Methylomirabilota bacterium]
MISTSTGGPSFSLARRLFLLALVVVAAVAAYFAFGRHTVTLETLVRHRDEIGAFVAEHRVLAMLAYVGTYATAVSLSVPSAALLSAVGGFLFGLVPGAAAAALGATLGATVVFLVARTTLGEPLLKRAGPRATQLAQGFRDDAFSYLLFLRLVPIFPFFLVNLVPAFAGVRLTTFIVATALGVIPGALVYAFAGMGLDSVIAAQKNAYDACIASGQMACRLTFDARDVFTPELIGALVALGLLALVPALVKRLRARSHTAM